MGQTEFFANDMNYYLLTTFVFIIATILYGIDFFFRKNLNFYARITSLIGVVILSAGMAIRWMESGKPIFTSLFEMILWFAWGSVLIMLISELKFKFRHFGFFVLPFVVIIMGIILLMPGSAPGTQMPALQSAWLYFHVGVAIVSYSAFLTGFAAAIMYFIKKGINKGWFGLAASLFSAMALLIIDRGRLVLEQDYVVRAKTHSGSARFASFKEVGVLLTIAFLLYFLSSILYALSLRLKNPLAQRFSGLMVVGGTGSLVLGTLILVLRLSSHEILSVTSQPAEMAFLLSAVIVSVLSFLVSAKYDFFHERILNEEDLDSLQYFTVKFGFPFLTLTIITGAVWANKAWGSYWGNDPKEWASAVTWLVYAAYLHMRITRGWGGVRAAAILVIGFLAVMFTLIGVTYLPLGGLHSYV